MIWFVSETVGSLYICLMSVCPDPLYFNKLLFLLLLFDLKKNIFNILNSSYMYLIGTLDIIYRSSWQYGQCIHLEIHPWSIFSSISQEISVFIPVSAYKIEPVYSKLTTLESSLFMVDQCSWLAHEFTFPWMYIHAQYHLFHIH